MKRTFIEFPAFSRLVSSKQFSDEQVQQVQEDIINGLGAPLQGTGGVKKIRCDAPGRGKSGGWRVLYADYDKLGLTFLIWAFPKGRRTSLTDAQKKIIRGIKQRIDKEVGA